VLVDLHLHGAFGIDVATASPERLDTLSRKLRARGVSGFLPTLVPLPTDERRAALARLADYVGARRAGDGRGAVPLGIHLEGPFVSRSRCGALHPELFLDGTRVIEVDGFFAELAGFPGRCMVTLAPEIPGGVALVERFGAAGFTVAIGHTEATTAVLDAARAAGATHMTHFGNAMRPLHHRELGPIGWGLLHEDVTVDLIADLHHLHPDMLRLVYRVKGAAQVALISDAVPPAGQPDGDYLVWGERLRKESGMVKNPGGSLAGSACLLDDAVKNLVSIGIPEDEARGSASDVPRRILGAG
jgi:N-acetylglucosamine-6-phosphate deacetylase